MEAKKWWKETVVYQIYPRSFMDSNGDGIGDLRGIISRLDYLKDLGIGVIWMSPVYKSPNDDNGYDISDYQDIMDEFGTMEDFDELLSKAHERGIKIVMDLVVNHTSDEHPWFIESKKSKDNTYRDYYIWKEGKDGKEPNNWGSCFSGSAWEYSPETDMYYLHLFSKKQPDLNWENEVVRKEVFSMMNWWCEKGIDGFRMDVISLISKDQAYPDGEKGDNAIYGNAFPYTANGPRVHEFLQEMNREVMSKYDVMTVGETAGVTVEEAKKYASSQGNELNMVFQFEHVGLDDGEFGKWTDKRVNLVELKKNLTKWQNDLEGVAWNSLFWDNHDQPRAVSRFGNDTPQFREVSAKMLATCLHMMKGTPYIYQGEELGMTNNQLDSIENFDDIEIRNAYRELVVENKKMSEKDFIHFVNLRGRDNARTPMHWDSTENGGFTTGRPWLALNKNYKEINAKDQVGDPDSVFSYYKQLIALRKEMEIVVYGKYTLLEEENQDLFIYTRTLGDQKLLVICNFTEKQVPYEVTEEWKNAKIVISNYKENDGSKLQPYEAKVLSL